MSWSVWTSSGTWHMLRVCGQCYCECRVCAYFSYTSSYWKLCESFIYLSVLYFYFSRSSLAFLLFVLQQSKGGHTLFLLSSLQYYPRARRAFEKSCDRKNSWGLSLWTPQEKRFWRLWNVLQHPRFNILSLWQISSLLVQPYHLPLLFYIYLFYLLGCVLVAVSRIFHCGKQAFQLWCAGLVALRHVGSQFPDQVLNLCPQHSMADSLPLGHQESPPAMCSCSVLQGYRRQWPASSEDHHLHNQQSLGGGRYPWGRKIFLKLLISRDSSLMQKPI